MDLQSQFTPIVDCAKLMREHWLVPLKEQGPDQECQVCGMWITPNAIHAERRMNRENDDFRTAWELMREAELREIMTAIHAVMPRQPAD